ncbi:MAG: hypothetical protein V1676_05585 [Candidatus Diapherotrites archaeon]
MKKPFFLKRLISGAIAKVRGSWRQRHYVKEMRSAMAEDGWGVEMVLHNPEISDWSIKKVYGKEGLKRAARLREIMEMVKEGESNKSLAQIYGTKDTYAALGILEQIRVSKEDLHKKWIKLQNG